MTPVKLNVFAAFFNYGGNGGIAGEIPSIRSWYADLMIQAKKDERIGKWQDKDFSDTPITMTRNDAVCTARENGADVLVMIDSDTYPDYGVVQGDPFSKPFWDASFDFLYRRRMQGSLTVIGAPYCGPPPGECVYVFKWRNRQSNHPNADYQLQMYEREEAAGRAGIEEVAALPTGLIMFDLRVFDLIEPPYFYYEYTDKFQRQKASTEDVTATRDISLACSLKHGYNPLFCNWDSWAGHMKPKCVWKPQPTTATDVSDKLRKAMASGLDAKSRLVMVGEGEPKANGWSAFTAATDGKLVMV